MKQVSRLTVQAPAKLNLYLRILDKRKDNYHNLLTLFARISLADTVVLKTRKDGLIKITSTGIKVPLDKTNLCFRAAELLRREAGSFLGLDIRLNKRVPAGAGLGGGSSDAASVLLGLNRLWKLNLSLEKLHRLGAKLGSDVPFFIHQIKFGLGSGRGDRIKEIKSLSGVKLWFVLVYPGFKASTPLIYRKFDLFKPCSRGCSAVKKTQNGHNAQLTSPAADVKMLSSELSRKGKKASPGCFFNSLEPVTSRLYPEINQVKKALFGIGLETIMMSGSGPSVFGLCDSAPHARRIRNKLLKEHKTWQVFAVSTV